MFKNISDNSSAANGTCLQGYVDIAYKHLVSVFGEPGAGDGEKVDAEWVLQFDSGEVVTIYNYKNGKNYNGAAGKSVEHIRDWHIGGKREEDVALVFAALRAAGGREGIAG